MKEVSRKKIIVIDILVSVLAVAADQISKYLIRQKLDVHEYIDIIPGVFQFYHHENTGASWGIFQGHAVAFTLIAFIVIAAMGVLLFRIPAQKKFIRLHLSLSLIMAGALGNAIDRIDKGSVTDFLYAKIIDFPIFNVADCFIVCSTIWLMIMIIFIYKDEDMDFLNLSKKKSSDEGKDDKEETP